MNEQSKCTCILAPMGQAGLEGYLRGEQYEFEIRRDKAGRVYFRLFPDPSQPAYYETCGYRHFKKFFRPAGQVSLQTLIKNDSQ